MTTVSAPFRFTEADVADLLSVEDAHVAVREAFALLARGAAENPPRIRTRVAGAEANTMWAAVPERDALGVKLYPIVRDDVTRGSAFTFVLYRLSLGQQTHTARAVLDAELLGQRRTGAASAVAAAALAPQGASVLGIVGAGGQARHQAAALLAALPFERALIAGRTPANRDALVAELNARGDVVARASSAERVAREADVLVTITGSAEPVIHGDWLRGGTLVIAAGSNVATKRELDRDAVKLADRVIVDDRATAAQECGDLLANGLAVDDVEELAAALEQPRPVQDYEIALVETHGLAIEDLMCALHVVDAAVGA